MKIQIYQDEIDLESIFPFSFSIDSELKLSDIQPSLEKLVKESEGKNFFDIFIIKRPWSFDSTFSSFLDYSNQLFLISIKESDVLMRGQFKHLQKTNKLIFFGSPWITSAEDLTSHNLLLTDYAISDSSVDMLQLLKAQEINLHDVEELLFKLNTQKEFYEGILNSIPSDIAAFGPNQEYLYVNPVGIKNPELRKWIIGKTDYDYCNYRNRSITIADGRKEKFDLVKSSRQQIEWEESLVDEQKNSLYFLRKMYPVFNQDNSLKMILGYGVNITERKRIEEELRKREELYRLVMEATNDGIWDWDIATDYVFFNKRLKEMFGYGEDEFENHISMWRKIMHPADIETFQEILTNHLEKDLPYFFRLRFIHKNGDIKWIMCRGFAIRDQQNRPYRMLGSYIDVTDAKETEETLLKAKVAAEEVGRSKEAFLANMSHEIRTPLNGIIGMANLIKKTKLDEVQSEYLNAIKYSADNLLVIINDILDLAKIEAGKLTLESIDFDVVEISKNALKSLTYKAEEKGIQLNGNFPSGKLIVKGDPYRLTQILTNLLNNAIKFTINGKVELSVQLKQIDTQIEVSFKVKDTGIGIHRSKLASIFDSFSQAQSDTTRKFGGTGLGLAICKNLVEMQGGNINVESEFGMGSEFYFHLTYNFGIQELEINDQSTEELTFRKLDGVKILLAEDNEINQFLACELLKSWGMQADSAKNGFEAIELWSKNKYDLILMDIQMPELGGVEAAVEIRSRGTENSKVPIIALTANALKGQKEKFMGFGMNDYLSKPFNEAELYSKILALLPEETKNNTSIKKMSTSNYDFTKLQQISNGNKNFEQKLLGVFVDTVPESLQKLRAAFEESNAETVATMAHKLKTTINAMGIEQLKAPIQNLEDMANSKRDFAEIAPLVHLILDTLDGIVEEFKARLT